MPIIELDIGGVPRRVQVEDGYTPEDLDHIAESLGPQESGLERAGSYVQKRAGEFVGAGQGVLQDVENLVGGKPYGTGFPGERKPMETALDVAQVAGPVSGATGLGLSAAGLAGGAGARYFGADPETAEAVETGVNLAGGLGSTLYGAAKGVREAPKLAKRLIQGKYDKIAGTLAQKGTVLSPQHVYELENDLRPMLAWGGTKPGEVKAVRPLLDKIQSGGALTYADLDSAYAGLGKVRGPSEVRQLIDTTMGKMLEGMPEGAIRTQAKAGWKSLKNKPFQRGLIPSAAAATGLYSGAQHLTEGEYGKAARDVGLGLATAYGLRNITGRGLVAAARGGARPGMQAALVTAGSPGGRDVADFLAEEPEGEPNMSVGEPAVSEATPAPEPDASAGRSPYDQQTPDEIRQRQRPVASPEQTSGLPPGVPYSREIGAVSRLTGLPGPLLVGVLRQESGFNPTARSHPEPGQAQTPAHGLMQITPETFEIYRGQAEELMGRKVAIGNPLDNLLMGALLYKNYLNKTGGDVAAAARLYFGPETPYGRRTQKYGQDIANQYRQALRETQP